MPAEFICRVGESPIVPRHLLPPDGEIPPGRLQGTPYERLCELAGRICYDSLRQPKSRTSSEYHKHIREVGHLSVVEHAYFTAIVTFDDRYIVDALASIANRPSLQLLGYTSGPDDTGRLGMSLSLNLRHVLEWNSMFPAGHPPEIGYQIGAGLHRVAHQIAPSIVTSSDVNEAESRITGDNCNVRASLREPLTSRDRFLSIVLSGSRGMTHEWVRHKVFSAVSQRSTRFVDESESPWVTHPLLLSYLAETPDLKLDLLEKSVVEPAQKVYHELVNRLQAWLIARGVDKTAARKQSRGAARGYLGNALHTEMVYTASEAMWAHIFRSRASAAADAEIRSDAVSAFEVLAPHSVLLSNLFEKVPSPDGLGHILVPRQS